MCNNPFGDPSITCRYTDAIPDQFPQYDRIYGYQPQVPNVLCHSVYDIAMEKFTIVADEIHRRLNVVRDLKVHGTHEFNAFATQILEVSCWLKRITIEICRAARSHGGCQINHLTEIGRTASRIGNMLASSNTLSVAMVNIGAIARFQNDLSENAKDFISEITRCDWCSSQGIVNFADMSDYDKCRTLKWCLTYDVNMPLIPNGVVDALDFITTQIVKNELDSETLGTVVFSIYRALHSKITLEDFLDSVIRASNRAEEFMPLQNLAFKLRTGRVPSEAIERNAQEFAAIYGDRKNPSNPSNPNNPNHSIADPNQSVDQTDKQS